MPGTGVTITVFEAVTPLTDTVRVFDDQPVVVKLTEVVEMPTSLVFSVTLADRDLPLIVRVVGTALTSLAVSDILLDKALLLTVRAVGTAPTLPLNMLVCLLASPSSVR